MTDAREIIAPAHPADIIAQDIRRFSRTEGAGRVGEITLSSLLAAGFRILGPDEVDPVTVEKAASCGDAWSKPSALKLAAGEMTAQELRTAQAVARGISVAIRTLGRKA